MNYVFLKKKTRCTDDSHRFSHVII